jgi:hypothetical protein
MTTNQRSSIRTHQLYCMHARDAALGFAYFATHDQGRPLNMNSAEGYPRVVHVELLES